MTQKIYKILAIFIFIVSAFIINTSQSSAVSTSGFEPGNIIDDAVFTNVNSMSVSQIQAFLNSKVPTCDNWGTMGSTPTSRRDYLLSIGETLPIKCLKEYVENGKSSAQIIYDAAQEYKINAQVILVLLQKEQALITDDWPATGQYRSATGYGCPDTAACDTLYYGFTNQVRNSSRMFRAILNASPTWYTPYNLGNNYIRYNPNYSCGGTNVYIQNRATQALYNYTPYQPNASALAAGYGSGDSCGAYGNRNFYLYFTDWFGSTKAINGNITLKDGLTTNIQSGSTYTSRAVTASYSVYNSAEYPVAAGRFGVCANLNGINYDFGITNTATIAPKTSLNISFSKIIDTSGSLFIYICAHNQDMGGWLNYYPYNTQGVSRSGTFTVLENPLITTGVSFSPKSPAIGQTTTATFSIKNTSDSAVNIGTIAIAARDISGKNIDFAPDINITIPANSTYTYTKTNKFTTVGKHTFYIANNRNGVWSSSYPKSINNTVIRNGYIDVVDNPLLSAGVSINPEKPAVGQLATFTMSVNNASDTPVTIGTIAIAIRDSVGRNQDLSPDINVTIPANSTYVYTKNRTFTTAGNYTFFIVNNRNGAWSSSYPKSSSSNVVRSGTFTVLENPLITTGVSFSPKSPAIGQTTTATFSIKNTSDSAVNIGTIAIAARDISGKNIDFAPDINITIPANSTYTYTKTNKFTTVGKHTFYIANNRNGVWSSSYPKSINNTVIRNGYIDVVDNPLLSAGVSINPEKPAVGQLATFTMSVNNASDTPVTIGTIAIAIRDSVGRNQDLSPDINVTIPANSTYVYTKNRTFTTAGNYTFFIVNNRNGAWSSSYPKSSSSNVVRSGTFTINN